MNRHSNPEDPSVESDTPDSENARKTSESPQEEAAAEPTASESRVASEPPRDASPEVRRSLAAVLGLIGCIVFGGAVTLVTMAAERPLPGGVVWGGLGCILATLGILGLMTPRATLGRACGTVDARTLLKPGAWFAVSLVAHFLSVVLAVGGVLPWHRLTAAVLVTSSFVVLLAAAGRLLLDVTRPSPGKRSRPLQHRHGFWLLVLTSLLYLPMLGNFALLDPWETHYGEVAREMLARDDWISLWWAQDGWFFTKPILNFWLQGLSFKLFGVEYLPDQMILSALSGRVPQPEWACRLPIFWITAAATYALYKASARLIGRHAAFIGGVVLITCPYWLLLARQTMADMPYVAPLVVAMACLMLAFHTDPEARVVEHRVRVGRFTLRIDAWHVLFGVVLVCLLPQVLYLLSRNVTLHLGDPFGFRPHLDEFQRGSGGGNCGLPGNQKCRAVQPLYEWGQPLFGALLWLAAGLGLLFLNRKERRTQRLLFLGAWFATALSVMAKGAPGLVLPLVVGIGYPIVTGRFRELMRLELASLLLLTLCVALPWYVQMFMRHGMPFFERLVLHDMVNRAFAHVHDTNKGDDVSFRYYVWQLGYGLFPWTGLAAFGLSWWARTPNRERSARQGFVIFSLLWTLAAFGMFSLTLTKFHHYILPLVPPAAMLTGLLVSGYLPRGLFEAPRRGLVYLALLVASAEALLLGVACFFSNWKSWLFLGDVESPASPGLAALFLSLGAALFGAATFLGRDLSSPKGRGRPRDVALAALAIAGSVAVALAGRDMFVMREGNLEGPIRLLHLITYNYDRPWPENLDLQGPLVAFTAVSCLAMLGLAVFRLRSHFAVFLVVVSVLWGGFCCNDYLVRIAPHWSQRDNMLAYYQHRNDDSEMLVAYQMNWKGENFYTGNNMATFVSSGAKFKRWVKKMRKRGTRTMFFTTEHTRVRSLKKELGNVESFEELTTEEQDNKFFVAKVVFPPFESSKPDDDDDDDE